MLWVLPLATAAGHMLDRLIELQPFLLVTLGCDSSSESSLVQHSHKYTLCAINVETVRRNWVCLVASSFFKLFKLSQDLNQNDSLETCVLRGNAILDLRKHVSRVSLCQGCKEMSDLLQCQH